MRDPFYLYEKPAVMRLPKSAVLLLVVALSFIVSSTRAQEHTVAREWNEQLLFAIRNDLARPTVHARNLFHTSVVMYDAWAAYDTLSATYFLGNTHNDVLIPFEGVPEPLDLAEARDEAVSYAAYRLLKHRFQFSPGAETSLASFDQLMADQGYDMSFTSTDYQSGDPRALGNYIAAQMIDWGLTDGSNEDSDYTNDYYLPINEPLDMTGSGSTGIVDPNRWQALELSEFIDQAGNPFTTTPPFLSPEWGNVVPFALADSVKTTYEREGNLYHVYHDPGPPPLIDTLGAREGDDAYRWGFSLVAIWQSHHDPADGVLWDISPASIGNIQELPENYSDYPEFYDLENGGDPGLGHDVNPATGLPYEPQIVPRADYARVLAEFWADGPDSETPPGHWYTILNTVNDSPELEKRWRGEGPVLDDLEWDVKTYFALGGAVHDAAIAAWSVKGWYDYIRPVSALRFMADRGQNTDPDLPSYDPAGIPLVDGFIELVEEGDPLAGAENEHVGKIKFYTWRGPDYIEDPEIDMAGVGWILAENWWPYQRPTFVTPPFAGFVSGHSTYSRAAAEVMTLMTGDAFFPGGMGEFEAPQNEFLVFEDGPSVDMTLQWATYRDASDQCSLSRIWGGIHPPADDIPGRIIGMKVGINAFDHANEYIESGLPRVLEVNVSEEIINSLMAGDSFTVEAIYDREMDTAVLPVIEFTTTDADEVLIPAESEWISSDTLVTTFTIVNAGLDIDAVTVAVSGGQDPDGLFAVGFEEQNAFSIDQIAPGFQAADPEVSVVNESFDGNTFEVDLFFTEPMQEESPLQLQLADEVSDATAAGTGEWLTPFQWRQYFDVTDTDLEIETFIIDLSDAYDVAGNPLADPSFDANWSIDLRQPEIGFASPSTFTVTATNIDTGFELFFAFDEAMNTAIDPVITLEPGEDTGMLSVIEAAWLNPFNYQVTYTVEDAPVSEALIDVSVAEATDAAGNVIAPASYPAFFMIDLDGTNVKEETLTELNLYPVPLHEGQALMVQTGGLRLDWELYDSRGKLVLNGNSNGNDPLILPTEALSTGSYLMRFSTGTTQRTLRFVVE